MSAIRAINIALVGVHDLAAIAKHANQSLVAIAYPETFVFEASHLTPHVSLLQLYANKDDITSICSCVEKIAQASPQIPLQLKEAEEGPVFGGLHLPGIAFKTSDEIKNLHQQIFDAVSKFAVPADKLSGVNLPSTFCNSIGDINQDSVDYVKKFISEKSKDKFSPHMTVGCAPNETARVVKTEIEAKHMNKHHFETDAIVVGHLANFCTIGSIFGSYDIARPTQTK